MSDDTKKIRIWVSTDRVGSRIEREFEVEADLWNESNDQQKNEWASDLMHENCMFNWDWEEA